MTLTVITFLTALAVSAVAGYFSIVGLVAIFSAAMIPIAIMGSTLEVAKLVTASWIYRNWDNAPKILKYYFIVAVIILSFITSMGIFGFLSKAHIEQTASAKETTSQVARIETEIERLEFDITRTQQRIEQIQEGGLGASQNIQRQIDEEQKRITLAYERIQPIIDEQNAIIENQTKLYTDRLERIDSELNQLQQFINNGEVTKAQSLVGVRADGRWGPNTAAAINKWQENRTEERNKILSDIKNIIDINPSVKAATQEIKRLRDSVELQVKSSNELISKLQNQLATVDADEIERTINELQTRVKQSNDNIDSLMKEKFALEAEFRKLEVEVGPVKYITELIYGTSDDTLIEKAVRWVIIVIIFVFDPLAILLLIAANMSQQHYKKTKSTPDNPAPPNPTKSSSRRKTDRAKKEDWDKKFQSVPKPDKNDVMIKKSRILELPKELFKK